jgi:Fic family protein
MILKSIMKVRNDFKKEYLKQVIKLDLERRGIELNKRQEKIMEKTITFGKELIDIEFYKKINKVTQETARKDLNDLVEMGIYSKEKSGKKYQYKLKMKV